MGAAGGAAGTGAGALIVGDVHPRAHEVQRPALDLVVDTPDVLADDPDRDQLDPAQQQYRDRQRAEAGEVGAEDPQDDHDRDRDECERRDHESEQRRELKRTVRERRNRIQREPQHLRDRVFRLSREATVTAVRDRGLAITDPDGHAAQEPIALAHRQQRIEGAAVEQPEVARVVLELDLRQPVEQRVEPARGGELEARLAFSLLADGIDDVTAGAPVVEHAGDELRRILKVGVEHHDRVATRMVEAGGERRLMPEIARELNDADSRVGRRELVELGVGGVGGAVVDEHDLEPEPVERGAYARVELLDRRFLVVHGRDDAEQLERSALVRGVRAGRLPGVDRARPTIASQSGQQAARGGCSRAARSTRSRA